MKGTSVQHSRMPSNPEVQVLVGRHVFPSWSYEDHLMKGTSVKYSRMPSNPEVRVLVGRHVFPSWSDWRTPHERHICTSQSHALYS
jgi:hypothetical protein